MNSLLSAQRRGGGEGGCPEIRGRGRPSPRGMKGRLPSHLVPLRSGQIRVAQLCPRPASPAHGGPPPRPFPRAGPAHRTSRGGRNARRQPALRVRGEEVAKGSPWRNQSLSPQPAASSGSAARGGSPLGCVSSPSLPSPSHPLLRREHLGYTGPPLSAGSAYWSIFFTTFTSAPRHPSWSFSLL